MHIHREEVPPADRFRFPAFGLHVSGFRVQGSGFRVQGPGFKVRGSGFRVQDSGFRQGSGFRVQGSGFRVQGAGCEGTHILMRPNILPVPTFDHHPRLLQPRYLRGDFPGWGSRPISTGNIKVSSGQYWEYQGLVRLVPGIARSRPIGTGNIKVSSGNYRETP